MKKLLAVLLFLLVTNSAYSQVSPCAPRLDIIKRLAQKYKESPKFIAIAGEKNLVEIFISKAGTWTILVTSPLGKTCIVAAGEDWEELPPVTIIEGPDAGLERN